MEREPVRAWRRKQTIRKWYRRLHKLYFYSGYNTNGYSKEKRFESWKDLKDIRWFKRYKDTGHPCSCPLCTGERYSRLEFSLETKRIIREELFD